MAFTDVTSMMGGRSWNGAAIGASLGGGMRQSKLGQLANAYANAGDPAAQKTAIQNATAFDPETGAELQGKQDTQQKEARAKAGQAAKYILAAHESGGAMGASKAYKEVLPWLSEAAKTHGAAAPPDWDENTMLENVRGLAAMDGGGDDKQRGILANDGNIVDPNTGRVIYQGSPKPQYEIITDPQTGQVYRVPKTPGAAEQVTLGGGQAQAANQQPMTGGAAGVTDDAYANAIAGIESAGSGDYAALGPATKNGDRALGKYQVMGANIPQWTMAALGKSMSPQEYLANPQAQDAVFKHRFGEYVKKYGPEGAAKAWFAGEGGMKNPNAKDVLGTSVAEYGQKFMKGLGQSDGQPLRLSPKTEQITPYQRESLDWQKAKYEQDGKRDAVKRAEAAKAKANAAAEKMQSKSKADEQRQAAASQASNQLVTAIESLEKHPGFNELGTVLGDVKLKTPLMRNDVKDAHAQLKNVAGQIALTTMSQLRALSSQGATGFGALSAPELKLLENSIATLQSDEISNDQLKSSLKVIKDSMHKASKWSGGTAPRQPAAPKSDDVSDLLEKYK